MKNKITPVSKITYVVFSLVLVLFMIIVPSADLYASEKAPADRTFFEISDRASFENFIKKSRKDPSLNARLVKDIVLNDQESFESQKNLHAFESVYGGTAENKTPYTGEFDGGGHVITGYVTAENLPLFNIIDSSAYVHDLTLDCSVFSPTHNRSGLDVTEYCASLSQVNYGHIENVEIHGSVTGRGLCAGIAGVNESTGLIEGCTFKGRVIGGIGIKTVSDPTMKYAFEFVVINNGIIRDCKSEAEIKSVAGLSVPYTLDGYPAKETAAEADGKAKKEEKSGRASEEVSGNKVPSKKREDDYIGPDRDLVVKLVRGDSLWALSRVYYGAGIKYTNMKLKDKKGKFGGLEGHDLTRLLIGTEVFIPRLDITEKSP